ncbi:prolipoprotein diacylglyceryl transferase family protein [Pseudemcibacter aquimaris]|uniref:prolipoprotein diacylglyceryl transferase family protein n=1 Tax=Pseudemcibacter aquimaris TaxID=2857064 RepID=UPI002011EFDA|nr:prolipoprotein diacylglyceryl transferase family protein [Pseudemcibacter aquimaris]MCC3860908.1 prolipoprotein diacylglyceryl transferase [Pseudemcibacter aquimaris]WDU59727.1 prolipoprotein diacylglyceryl transferase [Pseudemcibacter aquimaris]
MKKSPGHNFYNYIGKFLYGAIFVVVLPAYLIFWEKNLGHLNLPTVPNIPYLGEMLVFIGFIISALGIREIMVKGEGLPMNAYPPKRYVTSGAFKWLSHPIYFGFCLLCLGISLSFGCRGGIWIITPIVILSCMALVFGYERPFLIKIFGNIYFEHKLTIPTDSNEQPNIKDYYSVLLFVFLPWLVLYEGVVSYIGVIEPVLISSFTFDDRMPVIEFLGLPYVLTYPLVVFSPLLAKSKRSLRQFSVAGIFATILVIIFYLTVPIIADFREFEPKTIWGELIEFQQSIDNPATAFPAFHVIWAFLSAKLLSDRFPNARIFIWMIAWLIALSSWLTGMHALLDIISGVLVYGFVSSYQQVWAAIRIISENLANSWKEWRVGPIRVINHAFYTGLGGAVCIFLNTYILGEEYLLPIFILCFFGIVMAGLWGQYVEGSEKLKRPFGYFGSMVGAIIGGMFLDYFSGLSWLTIIAAICISAPWVQSIGRVRCLIHGCCHGRKTNDFIGIKIDQEKSRVCSVSSLKGMPIHPTPIYSIIGNLIIGLILFRLMVIETQTSIIIGIYLMLLSIFRFVEESFRGEAQTLIVNNLTIYQWISIGLLVIGSIFTMIPSQVLLAQQSLLSFPNSFVAISFGVIVAIFMSIDFPNSKFRFSRLT